MPVERTTPNGRLQKLNTFHGVQLKIGSNGTRNMALLVFGGLDHSLKS